MIHTNYQPARKGLIDQQIFEQKEAAIDATMRNGDAKSSVMVALYGGRRGDAVGAVSARFGCWKVHAQRLRLKYSDRGDFTRCYRGGF